MGSLLTPLFKKFLNSDRYIFNIFIFVILLSTSGKNFMSFIIFVKGESQFLKMSNFTEQGFAINFVFAMKIFTTDTLKMLQRCFGDEVWRGQLRDVSDMHLSMQFKQFKWRLGIETCSSSYGSKNTNFFSKNNVVLKSAKKCYLPMNLCWNVATDDETWLYAFDPETASQSPQYRAKNE